MRKFRAWNPKLNKMEYDVWPTSKNTVGHWIKMAYRDEWQFSDNGQTKVVIEEYTGLKDLWQGDICTAEYRCPVCSDNEPHLLTGTIEQADNGLWMFDYGHGAVPLDSKDLEILEKIGNIHENKDLLDT